MRVLLRLPASIYISYHILILQKYFSTAELQEKLERLLEITPLPTQQMQKIYF